MRDRFSTPMEFSENDDKWFKWFGKTAIITLLCCISVDMLICKFLMTLGVKLLIPIIFLACVTAVITGCTMITIPQDNYLKGGGCTIANVLMKKHIRKKNSCIYVKGYNQFYLDTEAAYLVEKKLNEDDSILRYRSREAS